MGTQKVVIGIVCALVIIVAIVVTVKREASKDDVPDRVLAQKMTYMCGACGAEQEIMLKDWQKLSNDEATGYRKCPKCGAMKLGMRMTCSQCNVAIVGPPMSKAEPKPGEGLVYECPKCHKNAFLPLPPPAAK